jgi:predicted nuclease of predicted toxin-antitoxin system
MPHNNWEIWLDTQISPIIAKWMTEYTGIVFKSSYILSLNTLTDTAIYEKAKAAGNVIIISKDADFHELISRLGSPPKLINLKKGSSDNRLLWEFLKPNINHAINILASSDVDIVELD